MPVRVGIDLISVDEIRSALDAHGDAYLRRVFTAGEIRECSRVSRLDLEGLAERFAAKEATFKVLDVGRRAVSWRDVEVLGRSHSPLLLLHGNADTLARGAGLLALSLGLFHRRNGPAGAVVIAQTD